MAGHLSKMSLHVMQHPWLVAPNEIWLKWSVVQSPCLAHLNSSPMRLSSAAWWSIALPSLLGWLPHLIPCSAWHHRNKGLQDHWNLPCWGCLYELITSPSAAGPWSHGYSSASFLDPRGGSLSLTHVVVLLLLLVDFFVSQPTVFIETSWNLAYICKNTLRRQ